MANVVTLQKAAQEIAERALGKTRSEEAIGLSLSEAFAAFHAHAVQAQSEYNGRELTLFESEPHRVAKLVDTLLEGNYRDTAATIAGITARALRMWMQKAEEGDRRYEAFAQLVRLAEAVSESASVRNVRAAGKDPRFWAAEMTYLERKYPDRWGRRADTDNSPRVVVQIGVKHSDVRVNVVQSSPE
jgi:hypothetical protein